MRWLILVLLLMPTSYAWLGTGHENIVSSVYYQFDNQTQNTLNLSEMKRGSTDPDLVFHDTRLHHFPPSYERAVYWLSIANQSFQDKDFNNASYAFGVASHYISDSFAAPHTVSGEDPNEHSEYERVANSFIISDCKTLEGDLFSILSNHTKPEEWQKWRETRDKSLIYNNYKSAFQAVNSKANIFTNELITIQNKKTPLFLNKEVKLFLILLVGFFISGILRHTSRS